MVLHKMNKIKTYSQGIVFSIAIKEMRLKQCQIQGVKWEMLLI